MVSSQPTVTHTTLSLTEKSVPSSTTQSTSDTTTSSVSTTTSSVSTTTSNIAVTGTAPTHSTGEIAGIVIGVLAAAVIILVIVIFVYTKRKRSHRHSDEIPYLPGKDELQSQEVRKALAVENSQQKDIKDVPDLSQESTQNNDYVNIDLSGNPSEGTDPALDVDGYMKKTNLPAKSVTSPAKSVTSHAKPVTSPAKSVNSKQTSLTNNKNMDNDANKKTNKLDRMHRPFVHITSGSQSANSVHNEDAKSQTSKHHDNRNEKIKSLNDSQKEGLKNYSNLKKADQVDCEDHQKQLQHNIVSKNVDSIHHLHSDHQKGTSVKKYANVKDDSADTDKKISACIKSKKQNVPDISSTKFHIINEDEENYVNVNKISGLINKTLIQDELYEN